MTNEFTKNLIINLHGWLLLCLTCSSSPCITMKGALMPYDYPDRPWGVQIAMVESPVRREVAVDAHTGTREDFMRRLANAAHEAATDRSKRDAYLEQLPEVATDERNLMAAFNYLETHGGQAAGVDGISYRDIPAGYRWQYVRQLRDALRSGDYRPAPLRKVRIPKGPGRGKRELQLPAITDRIIGRAVAQAVEPYLDAEFEPTTFGYRSGADRSRLHALATAEALAIQGNARWWLTADIRNAFGSIPRNRLLDVLQQRLTPSR